MKNSVLSTSVVCLLLNFGWLFSVPLCAAKDPKKFDDYFVGTKKPVRATPGAAPAEAVGSNNLASENSSKNLSIPEGLRFQNLGRISDKQGSFEVLRFDDVQGRGRCYLLKSLNAAGAVGEKHFSCIPMGPAEGN